MQIYSLYYIKKSEDRVSRVGLKNCQVISDYIFKMTEPALMMFSYENGDNQNFLTLESVINPQSKKVSVFMNGVKFDSAKSFASSIEDICHNCRDSGKYFSFPDLLAVYSIERTGIANVSKHLLDRTDIRHFGPNAPYVVVYIDRVVIYDGYDYYSSRGPVQPNEPIIKL